METPPFLRLAAETRDQIYAYLLSTKYTKHYPREEDPEWEYNYDLTKDFDCTPRPTHVYRFHPGILGANRQINREASCVLYDQNMFVEVTSDLTDWNVDFEWLGVPIVAEGAIASGFVYSVLHIKVELEHLIHYQDKHPFQRIFAGADLPAFCTALLLGGESSKAIYESTLLVNLHCNTTAETSPNRASFTIPQVKSLLEPLRILHSFQSTKITGSLDEQYKTELCLDICKKAPSLQERSFKVRDKIREGDDVFNARNTKPKDLFRQAIRLYEAAMTDLKNSCSIFDRPVRMLGNPISFSTAGSDFHHVYTNIVFSLRIRLAAAHAQLEQYEQCRKWSGRAVRTIDQDGGPPDIDHEADLSSMQKAVDIAPHLEEELKLFEDDERKHRERQLRTVREVLALAGKGLDRDGRKKRYGQPFVMRYPADFDRVKKSS
ncbi:hypothetical protein HO173_009188 [Letharia columbiana]|uniref:Uncharacterized protein n=1 Tax=Letharia columbiana TaxID=112416 RepID=A0A8H6L1Z0_9LECA|nr:uncharacterized protein HO173_009188 [Letharia columbiana]KAF6232520.1 hypothetical protein HO173_009188 [Letharia columbiana]